MLIMYMMMDSGLPILFSSDFVVDVSFTEPCLLMFVLRSHYWLINYWHNVRSKPIFLLFFEALYHLMQISIFTLILQFSEMSIAMLALPIATLFHGELLRYKLPNQLRSIKPSLPFMLGVFFLLVIIAYDIR